MKFNVKNLKGGYGERTVLNDVTFEILESDVLCILGANGAGKSTLFKSVLGLIPLLGGELTIDGSDITKWSKKELAKHIGYIPQSTNPPFSYSVMDMILMGRTAHLHSLDSPGKEDHEIVFDVIREMKIEKLLNKSFRHLSGGEKQLVIIARALTQNPKILVMDEPTAALDFGNQQMVLNQIDRLRKKGMAIIMASHFPDHAFMYSTDVLMIKDGTTYRQGPPDEIVTEESLRALYGVDTKIIKTNIRSIKNQQEIKVCVPIE